MTRLGKPALIVFAVSTVLFAAAPPDRVWRVGVLVSRKQAPLEAEPFAEFPIRLRELGYREGQNLVIKWRYAEGDYSRLPALATRLVLDGVDVIVAADGTPPALAASRATRDVPIVFNNVSDPVGVGLVKTLARPGGNVTGLALVGNDTPAKQMELLGSAVPALARIAILINPANPQSRAVIETLHVLRPRAELLTIGASNPAELAQALAGLREKRPGALVVAPEALLYQERVRIAQSALKLGLPSIGGLREYAEAGGLMSYGPNRRETCRRSAEYVDRILRGAKPSELPVEMPTKLELVVNKKTAKALGLTIPPELLVQADEVIE